MIWWHKGLLAEHTAHSAVFCQQASCHQAMVGACNVMLGLAGVCGGVAAVGSGGVLYSDHM